MAFPPCSVPAAAYFGWWRHGKTWELGTGANRAQIHRTRGVWSPSGRLSRSPAPFPSLKACPHRHTIPQEYLKGAIWNGFSRGMTVSRLPVDAEFSGSCWQLASPLFSTLAHAPLLHSVRRGIWNGDKVALVEITVVHAIETSRCIFARGPPFGSTSSCNPNQWSTRLPLEASTNTLARAAAGASRRLKHLHRSMAAATGSPGKRERAVDAANTPKRGKTGTTHTGRVRSLNDCKAGSGPVLYCESGAAWC